ncbi:MAG: S9 family peptidase [Alphaproteobacteria bacterium]|nr:MAG: S9 family peptidase [Alphaproteobacteria bacterium]
MKLPVIFATLLATAGFGAVSADATKVDYQDIFDLEYAAAPEVAPDGKSVVYERHSMDIMTDSGRSNIWTVNMDGTEHRPLLSGKANFRMPRFSPDGKRLAYVSTVEGKAQIYVRWLDTGQTARVTDLERGPNALSWSPDGTQIAFTMFVPKSGKPLFTLPPKPQGAEWAGNAKVIDKVTYRADGAGYLPQGYTHVFVVPADGGTPRQVTSGDYNYGGVVSWMPDSKSVLLSANRSENWQMNPRESEVYALSLTDGNLTQLTNRVGPDAGPQISPDGKMIAYVGFDDKGLSSQNSQLYVMATDGSGVKTLTPDLDRNVDDYQWGEDGKGLYYSFDDHGTRHVGYVSLSGAGRKITGKVGGTSISRPYTSGDFKAGPDGRVVITLGRSDRPADLAVVDRLGRVTPITALNEDVFGHKKMATVEELNFDASAGGQPIQAWLMKPADFDASKKYPMILEIHGGPHAAYGPDFAIEDQLYAANGYVVLYVNPRGSTSYGEDFANLIHHNYPSSDYDDLMDAVNLVLGKGFVDPDQMYVTGGSGGGVLTAWIVGKTDRFRAAVVAKPVINWTSFVLTADFSPYFAKYWFPDMPWNAQEHYWKHSPLSLVGNVKTPTMLLTGENDYRTPISETEQYYQALKLQGVDSVMVRIPLSGHGIANKPSNLIQKVGNILAWFKNHSLEAAKD